MILSGTVGPNPTNDGVTPAEGFRQGRLGELITTELHGRYYEQVRRGNVFAARAALAANSPTIFSTNTLTGGPVLWNGSTTVVAAVLAVGFGITVVSTVAASVGFTGGTGQIAVMTATTAADSVGNLYLGGPNPTCTAYRTATPAAAGTFFYPLCDVVTGALTTRPGNVNWIDVGGLLIVPPNCWCAISASATTTTMVSQFTLIWEEVPL